MPRLAVPIQFTAHFLLAVRCNNDHMLPFGQATARKAHRGVGISRFLRPHVKEVRRLEVTVPLRNVTEIVE
jgi:hypothetical protein